ncbi:MAG TPA: TolC family protein [Flavitalea sp.]|nr:TolC family protein [Flavitalea sp.]
MKYLLSSFFTLTTCLSYTQVRTLESYLRAANQNSPTLKEFQGQLLSLRIDSQVLKASLGPQVNLLSTNSYAPIIGGWGYDEPITNIANVSGLIQASRNFLTRGNIAAQYRTIALQRRALLDTIQLSQQELARTITDQYITTYGNLLSTNFNREVFGLLEREEQILKKLTEQGVYKQTDYLTFYVTMQQQELTYLQAQIQYNNDFLTLNYMCGLVDTTIGQVAKPALADSTNADFYNSVFYNRFFTDSLRLANERELINYEYKPKIGAYTDAGYNSSMQMTPYKNFGFSAGLSLVIPIYDGRQRQMKQSRIDIKERTRQNNREFYVSQYRMQLQQLKQQLLSIDMLVNKITKQIQYAHTLIVANGKLLQTGDITMKDYVIAINNYLGAQNQLAQNDISRLKILNQLTYWNLKP